MKEVLLLPDRVWVNTRSTTYRDECAIYVVRNADSTRIQPADVVWWQGRMAMWTPADNLAAECEHEEHVTCRRRAGIEYDIEIPRIGYSGVPHPAQRLVEQR